MWDGSGEYTIFWVHLPQAHSTRLCRLWERRHSPISSSQARCQLVHVHDHALDLTWHCRSVWLSSGHGGQKQFLTPTLKFRRKKNLSEKEHPANAQDAKQEYYGYILRTLEPTVDQVDTTAFTIPGLWDLDTKTPDAALKVLWGGFHRLEADRISGNMPRGLPRGCLI